MNLTSEHFGPVAAAASFKKVKGEFVTMLSPPPTVEREDGECSGVRADRCFQSIELYGGWAGSSDLKMTDI